MSFGSSNWTQCALRVAMMLARGHYYRIKFRLMGRRVIIGRRFREECLNVHWFASIDDAQQKIDAFRWDYNEHHPHRALEGLSPREFAERMLAMAAGSLSKWTEKGSPLTPV